MSDLLVVRLFGPFVSWGEIAVGEVRPSAVRPTRSALLGLLGAALGVQRGDEAGHHALGAALSFAVRVDAAGTPCIDYHTVQWRRPRREQIATRADELRVKRDELSTVQSRRHYRCDALATVAMLVEAGAPWSLSDLAAALERPVFPLSLGRKSSAPALPLAPQIVSAPTLLEAFALYDERQPLPWQFDARFRRPVQLAWGKDVEALGLLSGLSEERTSLFDRRDDPSSRRRWRFAVRTEIVATLGRGGELPEENSDVPEPPVTG